MVNVGMCILLLFVMLGHWANGCGRRQGCFAGTRNAGKLTAREIFLRYGWKHLDAKKAANGRTMPQRVFATDVVRSAVRWLAKICV